MKKPIVISGNAMSGKSELAKAFIPKNKLKKLWWSRMTLDHAIRKPISYFNKDLVLLILDEAGVRQDLRQMIEVLKKLCRKDFQLVVTTNHKECYKNIDCIVMEVTGK